MAWKGTGTLQLLLSLLLQSRLCSQSTEAAVLLQRGLHQLLECSKGWCCFYVDLASPLISGSLLPKDSAALLSSVDLDWILVQFGASLLQPCRVKALLSS